MKRVYEDENLDYFLLQKESKMWLKSKVISEEQFKEISNVFPTTIYQPPFFLQVVLFIATFIGVSSVTSVLAVTFLSNGTEAASFLSFIYGVGLFIFLDRVIYKQKNHFNSGVAEAFLYISIGLIAFGIFEFIEYINLNEYVVLLMSFVASVFIAFRYLKIEGTIVALGLILTFLFLVSYDIGGIAKHILPFTVCAVFVGIYFLIRCLKREDWNQFYKNHFLVGETICLLVIYASLNYFVVRELSISMIGLELEAGQDIPFAYLFYVTTLAIPLFYLYYGIKTKSILFIRTSLIVLACGVFTFKYYFSTGHLEISLTLAGAVLLGISIYLMRYLKTPKQGFTGEPILQNKYLDANLEAFVINNTMSVNAPMGGEAPLGQGGEFGGGGASGEF